jgi:hypothetical protein
MWEISMEGSHRSNTIYVIPLWPAGMYNFIVGLLPLVK